MWRGPIIPTLLPIVMPARVLTVTTRRSSLPVRQKLIAGGEAVKLWPATGHDINRCVAVDRIRRYQRSRTGRERGHHTAGHGVQYNGRVDRLDFHEWGGRVRGSHGVAAGDGEAVVGWEPATLRLRAPGRNVAGGTSKRFECA